MSPESGAYAGNRQASVDMFNHRLHDRVPSCADATAVTCTGRRAWVRTQGRRDSGLRMAEGRVEVAADSTSVQLGVDLVKADVGKNGAVYAGVMGGHGDARVRSASTLTKPGGAALHARADGKVSGYVAGVYGTYYQNDATRLGAYADTSLQAGRYKNQINSELGSARYGATVVSASLEAGYAVKPFAPDSALGGLVVQPQAQLTYSRYSAREATLQGTRMRSGNNNSLDARVGGRLYPQTPADAPAARPFLEANWLHRVNGSSVKMGGNVLDAKPPRNRLELKLGAEGRVNRSVQVSGHVFGQAGSGGQRGYGGMLNVGYRW